MTSEKLDIIMKITDTRNSALGRALSFDPSYIGRIRSGKRGIPKHMPFVEPAASYFAKNIKTDYQKKLISEIINKGKPLPEDKDLLEKIILEWLKDDNTPKNPVESIDFFLHQLSSGDIHPTRNEHLNLDTTVAVSKESSTLPVFFYGNEGKREATELFLSKLCRDGKPHTLLLFSDEDMTWLYEDPIFAKRWAAYLIRLLSNGSHIKIIHTIARNLNDIIEAIQNWLPLYISGDIEPYYYPRLRDGIYHRTLFLAVDQFAITSNSIGSDTADMPNIFITEDKVLKGLKKEFDNFLAMCIPLMKIYKRSDRQALSFALERFKNDSNDVYFLNSTAENEGDENTRSDNDINELINEFDNIVRIYNTEKRVPENISIIANRSTGVLVITDEFVFDTTEPYFTMTFLEYLSKI